MYVVHYILGNTNHWKMFSDYSQAWDFMTYQDKPLKVIKFCPTSPEPQIIWWRETEGKAKMPKPLVMPAVDDEEYIENEKSLMIEECVDKVHKMIYGLVEQLKRLKY